MYNQSHLPPSPFTLLPLFRTDPELALYGRYVVPQRLLEEGFDFRFPDLEGALGNLV
ncbi:DUF1731 domain-containing protein [Neolewinella agarilytica]|uniref:DUF1731 domain-containing protein n=1 Tax=Neolewinella agarilytica TaxID=478744 RepID=UPI000B7F1EC7|nr:DUF1731 domain-containing protein [Neolewinella agarilytica]